MFVRFLGVGGAINTNHQHTALTVDDKVLVDAPPAVAVQLRKSDLDLHDLNVVVISHLHADHFFGLPLLLVEYMLHPRERDLLIYGPPGLEERLITLLRLSYPDTSPDVFLRASRAEFRELKNQQMIENAQDITLIPTRVHHGVIETYGIEMTDGIIRVFFSADTERFDGLAEHIGRSDVAILDATTRDTPIAAHMSFRDVVDFAQANPDRWFFATHRSQYNVDTLEPNVIVPLDGDCFELWKNSKPTLTTNATRER